MARKRHIPPGTADDKRRVSELEKLLRAELHCARFSLKYFTRRNAEIRPEPFGGSSTLTESQKHSEEELDAAGLKALHHQGTWKQQLFSHTQVKALLNGLGSTARQTEFEALLDDLGVLFEDHVGTALGPVIGGYSAGTMSFDSPDKSIGVSKSADLWSYLLVDACLGTPRRTASKVLRWARGAPLAFETRIFLGRLKASSSFALPSGLSVLRFPCDSDLLETWLPNDFGVPPPDFLDRTVLRIPCKIAPVFAKPTIELEQPKGPPIVSAKKLAKFKATWVLPAGGVDPLMRALSLVCDVAVETPVIWPDYGEHAHFGQQYHSSNSSSNEPTPRNATESTLTADDLKKAFRLQPELCNLPADVETALQYWLKSKARRSDDADRLVFLRTALEALFLPKGNRGGTDLPPCHQRRLVYGPQPRGKAATF